MKQVAGKTVLIILYVELLKCAQVLNEETVNGNASREVPNKK